MSLLLDARDMLLDRITGDLVIVNGDIEQVSGVDAIAQSLRFTLQFYQGEFFLDETIGIPFFQVIFVKKPNLPAIREILRTAILSVVGVNAITAFNFDFTNFSRTLRLDFTVDTDLGALTLVQDVTV